MDCHAVIRAEPTGQAPDARIAFAELSHSDLPSRETRDRCMRCFGVDMLTEQLLATI